MIYPEQLLPRPTFKEITADLPGYFICRKVLDRAVLQEPLPPILPEELLGIETASDCFDYSTNLPGVFELEHNFLAIIGDNRKYFRTYWDFNSEVTIPIFQQDFEYNENIGWFFLPIERINGLQVPFNRKGLLTPLDEVATAVVKHTPNNSNFWHFSIKWKDANGFISTTNSQWKNIIIGTVRAILSEQMHVEFAGQEIPDELYLKN